MHLWRCKEMLNNNNSSCVKVQRYMQKEVKAELIRLKSTTEGISGLTCWQMGLSSFDFFLEFGNPHQRISKCFCLELISYAQTCKHLSGRVNIRHILQPQSYTEVKNVQPFRSFVEQNIFLKRLDNMKNDYGSGSSLKIWKR